MTRIFDVLCIIAIVAGAVWTYQVKRQAEASQKEITRLTVAIAVEKERFMFLQADWAYLTSPARLEKLVERFAEPLELRPMEASQVVRIEDLPPPMPKPESMLADNGDANLTTGSVVPTTSPVRAPLSIDDILRQDSEGDTQ